jgi:hypothetical protein
MSGGVSRGDVTDASCPAPSVDDEQGRPDRRRRAMALSTIGDLVARPRGQAESAAILELGRELARHAEQDVSLLAPVICDVTGCVLDHPHPDVAEDPRSPEREPSFAAALRALNVRPVGDSEGDIAHSHVEALTRARGDLAGGNRPRYTLFNGHP